MEILQKYRVRKERVPLKLIKKDLDLYPRVSTDMNTVQFYMKALASGESFPCIVLSKDYVIIDGFHRYDAHELLNLPDIDALIIEDDLSYEEMFALSVELNLRHGKRFEERDIQRIRNKYIQQKINYAFSNLVLDLFLTGVSGQIRIVDDFLTEAKQREEKELESVARTGKTRKLAGKLVSKIREESDKEKVLDEEKIDEGVYESTGVEKTEDVYEGEEIEEDAGKEREIGDWEEEELEETKSGAMYDRFDEDAEEARVEEAKEEGYEEVSYEDFLGGRRIYLYKDQLMEKIFLLCRYLMNQYEEENVDKRILKVTEEVAVNFVALGFSLMRDFAFHYKKSIDLLKALKDINERNKDCFELYDFNTRPFQIISESIVDLITKIEKENQLIER